MKVPLEEALRRNDLRTGRAKVPKDVVQKMYDSMQEPTEEEGIDVVFYSDGNIIWS